MVYTYSDGNVGATSLAINDEPLPMPSEMTIETADLHANAERNSSGYVTADFVRGNVYKVKLKWSALLPEDHAKLKTILGGAGYKTLNFLDDYGRWQKITVYKGDFSSMPTMLLATNRYQAFRNISVNLIQR